MYVVALLWAMNDAPHAQQIHFTKNLQMVSLYRQQV